MSCRFLSNPILPSAGRADAPNVATVSRMSAKIKH